MESKQEEEGNCQQFDQLESEREEKREKSKSK